MKKTYYIKMHNLIEMRIKDTIGIREILLNPALRGYAHYEVTREELKNINLDVTVGSFKPEIPKDAKVINRKYYVADNYFYCNDDYKILSWDVEIKNWDSNGKIELNICPHALGTVAIASRIIDCVVRFLLNNQQGPAIHCCGIVNNSKAALITGRSGVGKSTLSMRMLATGGKLLGDNWVIAHQKKARSFHSPINVLNYNVSNDMYQNMSVWQKIDLAYKTFLRNISFGYLKKSTPIYLKTIMAEAVAESAPLTSVLTLSQGADFKIEPMKRDDAIGRLVANDMMDREAFYRYMQAFSTVYPNGLVASHWHRLYKSMNNAFPEEAKFYDVTVPRRITKDHAKSVQELIHKDTGNL